MKVIPIVIGAIGTVNEDVVKGLEDLEIRRRLETIQATTFLRSVRLLKRVLEICCHSNSIEKPSTDTGVKSSQKSKIIVIIIEKKDWLQQSTTAILTEINLGQIGNQQTKNLRSKNWKKNNCKDTSRDKLGKLLHRWTRHGYARETWREKVKLNRSTN